MSPRHLWITASASYLHPRSKREVLPSCDDDVRTPWRYSDILGRRMRQRKMKRGETSSLPHSRTQNSIRTLKWVRDSFIDSCSAGDWTQGLTGAPPQNYTPSPIFSRAIKMSFCGFWFLCFCLEDAGWPLAGWALLTSGGQSAFLRLPTSIYSETLLLSVCN